MWYYTYVAFPKGVKKENSEIKLINSTTFYINVFILYYKIYYQKSLGRVKKNDENRRKKSKRETETERNVTK